MKAPIITSKLIHVGILSFVLIMALSCEKEKEENNTKIVYDTMGVSGSDTLNYYLGSYGDEEGVTIQKQAEHYELSEVKREDNGTDIHYYYLPEPGFSGTDYVELKAGFGSDGASPSTNFVITKLTIKVL